MTYRFYRAVVIGDGSRTNPWRSKLTDYITAGAGADFWDWINDARPLRYCLALCEPAVHTVIDDDVDIVALGPEHADLAAVNTWLESATISDVVVHARLELDGISASWIAAQTTRRQLMNYASRMHVVIQDVKRLRNSETMDIFSRALTSRVNQLPVATRTKIQEWMTTKGLDVTWIAGTTGVRQVLHYILENINWPRLRLGPIDFA